MREEIHGKIILLRKLRMMDAPDVYENINDWEIVKWMTRIPWPYKKYHATKFIRGTFPKRRKGTSYPFGICLKEDNKVIGLIDIFSIDYDNKKAELGYWLGRNHWGKGVMSEAISLMKNFAFGDLGLHRLHAEVYENNLASCRVLEKAGFEREGFLRDAIKKWDKFQSLHVYAKLAR